jgi:GGDEF domain-containing protein
MKAPKIPANEAQRLAALEALDILDTAPEERFDRITRIARRLFGVPIALVSLIDSDRQWFKSKQGLAATQTPRKVSFCGHAILGDRPFVVENAQQDERFVDNPLVTGGPEIRFYAGYPLAAADGSKIGTLCIISTEPRQVSADDEFMLQALATMVEAELAALDVATTDPATGLANLRGFVEIGDYVLGLASRLQHPLRLLLLRILPPAGSDNPSPSATEDRALLARVGRELLSRFAECDLVGRVGPRDFAVLICESQDNPTSDDSRLAEFVQEFNAQVIGAVGRAAVACTIVFAQSRHTSVEDLVSEAEQLLRKKRREVSSA